MQRFGAWSVRAVESFRLLGEDIFGDKEIRPSASPRAAVSFARHENPRTGAIWRHCLICIHGADSPIGMSSILNQAFALPPLVKQHHIVANVQQLMAFVNALETRLAASRAIAANLLSALVAELTHH